MKISVNGVCLMVFVVLKLTNAAFATDYPTKPITMITGYPGGGVTDTVARALAAQLEKNLGVKVVVEGRGGRDEIPAASFTARAKPDGYTIMMASAAPMSFAPLTYKGLPYDPEKDFTLITWIMRFSQVLISSGQSPFKTFPEFVEKAKAEPGRYSMAHNSINQQATGELLLQRAGIKLLMVAYTSGPTAVTDLLGGRVDTIVTGLSNYTPFAATGQLRALAVTGERRLSKLPEVPTMIELGYPDFITGGWLGIMAPKGLPPDVAARLTQAVEAAVRSKEFGDLSDTFGAQVQIYSGAEFAKQLGAEKRRIGPAVSAVMSTH